MFKCGVDCDYGSTIMSIWVKFQHYFGWGPGPLGLLGPTALAAPLMNCHPVSHDVSPGVRL